jgi:hypothetical protein
MPASVPMGTSYELHSFVQNHPQNFHLKNPHTVFGSVNDVIQYHSGKKLPSKRTFVSIYGQYEVCVVFGNFS